MPEQKPIVIGVGGFARSGKDTFVKIARKILKEHGYSSMKLAFADALKEEIDPFLVTNYGISAWTDDTEQKKIIRPFLVAHGCGKRQQTNGQYWVDKIDKEIEGVRCEDVIFISDCRFPNEVDWVHQKWGGWFVHVKKFSMVNDVEYKFDYEAHPELDGTEHPEQYYPDDFIEEKVVRKVYDEAPNDEEAENDPICERKADFRLSMENAIERELRVNGNKITVDSLVDNTYLNEEIKLCLSKCPLLTLE
jgi:hypothetical protein